MTIKRIPNEVKQQVNEIVERFNEGSGDPTCYYTARYRGLGRYLATVHGGDVRCRDQVARLTDERRQGAHARRVLESYQRQLAGQPALDILQLMGLFDRPAEQGALEALITPPAIQDLTANLQNLSRADWQYALDDLRAARCAHTPWHTDTHVPTHPGTPTAIRSVTATTILPSPSRGMIFIIIEAADVLLDREPALLERLLLRIVWWLALFF